MKKSATFLTLAAGVGLCALVWAQGAKSENVPAPSQAPAVSANLAAVEQGDVHICEAEEVAEAYTPTPAIKAPESMAANGSGQGKSIPVPPEWPEAPAIAATPKPVEDAASPQPPTPTPQAETCAPKMGDTCTVDGQKQVYFLGFGWIEDNDEPNVGVYVDDMYENGNKIGIMGE